MARYGMILFTATPFIVAAIAFAFTLRKINFSGLANILAKIGKNATPTRIEEELKRKSFHITGLLLPGYIYTVLHKDYVTAKEVVIVLGFIVTVVVSCELLRMFSKRFNNIFCYIFGVIMRPKEKLAFTGTLPLVVSCFIVLLLYPACVALTSMAYLMVGDAMAAVIGVSAGRHKLIGQKSLEGSLGCMFACTILGYALLRTLCGLGRSLTTFLIALLSGFFSAIAELISNDKLDDNLLIPLTSSTVIYVSGILFDSSFTPNKDI